MNASIAQATADAATAGSPQQETGNPSAAFALLTEDETMEKRVAGAEITINAPIETVWHAIVNAKIALMPMTVVESGWNVGDPITFSGEYEGKPFTDYGEVVAKEEGRSVSFSHWSGQEQRPSVYHLLRYDLADKDDSTHVVLTQSNVGDDPDMEAAAQGEANALWADMLQHLKKASEAGG